MNQNAPASTDYSNPFPSPYPTLSDDIGQSRKTPFFPQSVANESVREIRFQRDLAIVSTCGRKPAYASCPACRSQGLTQVEFEVRKRTYGAAALLCCLCWPVAWAPFCIDQCKYAVHKCPNCSFIICETPPCE
eukprot:TRINITY_DN13692_c0_g1_i19.p1 TRINITY_DN13692_c0_g1~~TRINITY_DN13692_c0_g1_i19.p1  ORF type:complete len:133 (+),score=16.78 TRINITY_DN13692_c0_g1_i19:188-586(+)